jgi:hypothetical protein
MLVRTYTMRALMVSQSNEMTQCLYWQELTSEGSFDKQVQSFDLSSVHGMQLYSGAFLGRTSLCDRGQYRMPRDHALGARQDCAQGNMLKMFMTKPQTPRCPLLIELSFSRRSAAAEMLLTTIRSVCESNDLQLLPSCSVSLVAGDNGCAIGAHVNPNPFNQCVSIMSGQVLVILWEYAEVSSFLLPTLFVTSIPSGILDATIPMLGYITSQLYCRSRIFPSKILVQRQSSILVR